MSAEVVAEPLVLAEVFVSGHPKTKGSLTAVTAKHLRDTPGSELWRICVVDRVRTDMAARSRPWVTYPAQGRIGVRVISYLQLPNPALTNWWERAYAWIMSKLSGDVDKLERNVLDALSACDEKCAKGCRKHAGLIGDDAQVWDLYGHKRLAAPGVVPGQRIMVWQIPEDEPWV